VLSGVFPHLPEIRRIVNLPEIRRFDRFAGFRAYCQICRKSGVLPILPEIGRIADFACVMGE
jgi:hypothetical protein